MGFDALMNRPHSSRQRIFAKMGALATAAVVSWPVAAAGIAESPTQYVEERLDNGLLVTIYADPRMPVVSTEVWYHVGAANEGAHSRGFAHLFEHLMFAGTAAFPRGTYARYVTRHGGYRNAYVNWDQTVYVSQVAPQHHRQILAMEADRMVNLELTEEALDNEKRIVTEELRLRLENNPERRALVAGMAAGLGGHPYATPPAGTREDIARATLDQCRRFYARYYGPRNAHLIVVGPVDPAAKLSEVRDLFGILPQRGEESHDVPALLDWTFPTEVELTEDIPPAEAAALAFVLPPATAPDTDAVLLMLDMIRDFGDFEDLLVRERRQALFAQHIVMPGRRGGGLLLATAALPYRRKETAFRYIDEALADLESLAWLSEDNLASARRKRLLSEWARPYRSGEMAAAIGEAHWWRGDGRLALDTRRRLEAVTTADVARAYRRYIADARHVRVYVYPERVPWYVSWFGWLYPLASRLGIAP